MMRGEAVFLLPELIVGTLSGVISGVVLQKIAPADSRIVLSSDESRSMVNQQIMNVGDGAVTIAGNGNYTRIGDDNSVHVNVAGESRRGSVDSDGDMWLFLGLGFAVFVVIAIFLLRYYEILVSFLVITSVFLMTTSLLTAGLSLRCRYLSKTLGSSIVASVFAVASTYATYWSCFTLSTGKSGLSMPDLSRMLSEAAGDEKLVPFADAFKLLSAESAFPYVSVVFMAMLVAAVLCFFALGMTIREFCERRFATGRAGSVSAWLVAHLPVPGWHYILGVLLLACVPVVIVVLFRNVQPTWLS
jgi:membrane protein